MTTSRKEEVKSGVGRGPVEHVLPGGVGTYSISYFNQQRVSKPEGASLFSASAETSSSISNCSSFTLWDESALKKGKTGKENIAVAAETYVHSHRGPFTLFHVYTFIYLCKQLIHIWD